MDPKKDTSGGAGAAIPGAMFEQYLPSPAGYDRRHTTSMYQHELKASEIQRSYLDGSGNSLFISIADLGNQPRLYKNFITGGGLRQSSVGNSFGLAFRQASLQGSAGYGLLLGQPAPAYLGQVSGVISMAESSQAIQFSVVTQAGAVGQPGAPLASMQFSPQVSPQFSPQASPQFSPQYSPQASPQVPPQFSPQFSPQMFPQFSPQVSPQFSPQFSPQISPQGFAPGAPLPGAPLPGAGGAIPFAPGVPAQGPTTAVVFVESTISSGQASTGARQISAMLQSSGVDLKQLAQVSQSAPFSLAESAGPDGSYIRPFGTDTGHDVTGWELYDARARIGTLILGMKDRIGILIAGTNLGGLDGLLELAGKLDYAGLDKLMAPQK